MIEREGLTMRKRLLMLSVMAASLGAMSTAARADHDYSVALIADRAEAIVCESRDLQSDLRSSMRDSALFGDLISTNARIRSKANYIRSQTRPGRSAVSLVRFVGELDELICRMDALIDEADWRVRRRLDSPLVCTRLAKARVSRMRFAIDEIRQALAFRGNEVGYPGQIGPYPWHGATRWDGNGPPDHRMGYPYGEDGLNTRRMVTVNRTGVTLHSAGLSVHFGR
jgi:hypothetical protein